LIRGNENIRKIGLTKLTLVVQSINYNDFIFKGGTYK